MNPILQLLQTPYTVDVSKYKNAQTETNPEGSIQAAYNLKMLVDPIPSMTHAYNPSGSSFEEYYGIIIDSFVTKNPFESKFLAQTKKTFEQSYLLKEQGMGVWRPITPQPDNWYYALALTPRQVNINPDSLAVQGLEHDFTLLPNDPTSAASWALSAGTDQQPLHSSTKIKGLTCNCLVVYLKRPWMDPKLFTYTDWGIDGAGKGYISNGNLTDNSGILPLYTTAMLVGHTAQIDADFHASDFQFAVNAAKDSKPVFLGPLPVSVSDIQQKLEQATQVVDNAQSMLNELKSVKTTTDMPPFLLGFISQMVPLSPPITLTS